MLYPESFEANAADGEWLAWRNSSPVCDWKSGDDVPGFLRRKHGAWRATRQSEGMIAMSVGEDDRRGRQCRYAPEPIRAAIDHDASAALPDEKSAMTAMAARSHLDLAACAEKEQFDFPAP